MRHRGGALVSILAVLALVAGACGGGDDSGGSGSPDTTGGGKTALPTCPLDALESATSPVDVTVWHTQTARPLEVLNELVAEYNGSQSKVRVHLESQGAGYPEIQRKFNESVASKQLPQLIVVDDTFTKSMADSGVILPAQACFEADGYDLDQLVTTARSYYTIDDVLWPVTAGIGTSSSSTTATTSVVPVSTPTRRRRRSPSCATTRRRSRTPAWRRSRSCTSSARGRPSSG